MARKARKIQDTSSDDEAPEVVPHSTSKADTKRNQKALHDFEAEERIRRKERNRERDQRLKERAHATRGGGTGEKLKRTRLKGLAHEGEDGEESGWDGDDGGDDNDVEARMLRAMRDAAGEVESGEGEEDEEDGGFRMAQGMDPGDDDVMASGSDSSFVQDGDIQDGGMSLGDSDSIGPGAMTDGEGIDEDEETTPMQADIIPRPSRKASYLADDLFATAFTSQNSKSMLKKSKEATQPQAVKKRRRKSTGHAKDLVIGGRTIRTLPGLSDPRSKATARSVPSARARRFADQSLAMRGKQALARAKKKGWERRPANVGVMKYQGAPHGFARSIR